MTPDELRQRRKALRLSQRKLAEALGVTQHTVSRWEEGKITLTAPRSLWLDVEMRRIERQPKRRRASTGPGREG
jgi:transcriptional regulator with XRE-family HTH domain